MKPVSLRRNNDFRRLYNRGKTSASQCMAVYCSRNRQAVTRVGFTVSTKLGGAVVRNRIRRRLRESFRQLSIEPGWDIVIVARFRAKTSDFRELSREMEKHFRKLGLMSRSD